MDSNKSKKAFQAEISFSAKLTLHSSTNVNQVDVSFEGYLAAESWSGFDRLLFLQ